MAERFTGALGGAETLGRAIGCVCCNFTVAFGKPPLGAPPGVETSGPVPVPGRGAVGMGRTGIVLANGEVTAPASTFGGAPGALGAEGRIAIGAEGGAGGRGAPPLGAVGGGIGKVAAGGAGGSFTGEDDDFGAGGGSGADGSWMGAVARFGATIGTAAVTGLTGTVFSRG